MSSWIGSRLQGLPTSRGMMVKVENKANLVNRMLESLFR